MQSGPVVDVKTLRDRFLNGKANNAEGTKKEYDTSADEGLRTHNARRDLFQFTDFKAKLVDEQKRKTEEEASLELARQLQIEFEMEERRIAQKQADEAASLALALELQAIENAGRSFKF